MCVLLIDSSGHLVVEKLHINLNIYILVYEFILEHEELMLSDDLKPALIVLFVLASWGQHKLQTQHLYLYYIFYKK